MANKLNYQWNRQLITNKQLLIVIKFIWQNLNNFKTTSEQHQQHHVNFLTGAVKFSLSTRQSTSWRHGNALVISLVPTCIKWHDSNAARDVTSHKFEGRAAALATLTTGCRGNELRPVQKPSDAGSRWSRATIQVDGAARRDDRGLRLDQELWDFCKINIRRRVRK